jgi:hypothetical protein
VRERLAISDRKPVERPAGAPRTFVCPTHDQVLWDDVDYLHCPVCGLNVDWVDLERPLWCCATCDVFVNEVRDDWPRCERCDELMDRVHALESPPPPNATSEPGAFSSIAAAVFPACLFALLVAVATHPLGFAIIAPIALAFVVGAGYAIASIGASLGEFAALARDRRTRVVHGLEHACIALLAEAKLTPFGGVTSQHRFVVELLHDGRATTDAVRQATEQAIRRIAAGETGLAYSRRCGTSLLVAVLLLSILVLGGVIVGLLAGLAPHAIAALVAGAAVIVWLASAPLGLFAQRLLTVSTQFSSAEIVSVVQAVAADGARSRFLVTVAIDRDGAAWSQACPASWNP